MALLFEPREFVHVVPGGLQCSSGTLENARPLAAGGNGGEESCLSLRLADNGILRGLQLFLCGRQRPALGIDLGPNTPRQTVERVDQYDDDQGRENDRENSQGWPVHVQL